MLEFHGEFFKMRAETRLNELFVSGRLQKILKEKALRPWIWDFHS